MGSQVSQYPDLECALCHSQKHMHFNVSPLSYRSYLPPKTNIDENHRHMYERIWDESDYVVPPAENSAFFVMTNFVLTPNQTRGNCPEDHSELSSIICNKTSNGCMAGRVINRLKGHGKETGRCVESDKEDGVNVCQVSSWCPIERDNLPAGPGRPMIPGAENYTVFIKNSVSFSQFGSGSYQRNNMPNGICMYKPDKSSTHHCPIFKLGDIVEKAGGNFTKLAIKGGVIGIGITWNCDLDWDFEKYCLPEYNFRILDTFGWNFRYGLYHEENRRTLIKAYGLKFLIVVDGRAAKFDLKNTVIVLVTGLGLLGLSTMFCDFVLLNYSSDRRMVRTLLHLLDNQKLSFSARKVF